MKKLQSVAKKFLLCLLMCVLALKAPELQYNYVRGKVQKATVYVTNETRTSGGSGSHVIAPSGKVYILTNAHVCKVGKNGSVFITDDFGRTVPRKILEVSNFTDLCLIEPLPNYHGALKVGHDVYPGEIVASVGHPTLMPTTMSKGEVIGQAEIDVFDHVIQDSDDKCDASKNRIIEVNSFFGPVSICVLHLNANLTTTTILPGNSGSPQIDAYGDLNGVFFAGNEANWGFSVTLKDVKEFLLPY